MESVSDSTDSTSLFSSVYDVAEVPSLGHTMAPEQIPSPDEEGVFKSSGKRVSGP